MRMRFIPQNSFESPQLSQTQQRKAVEITHLTHAPAAVLAGNLFIRSVYDQSAPKQGSSLQLLFKVICFCASHYQLS